MNMVGKHTKDQGKTASNEKTQEIAVSNVLPTTCCSSRYELFTIEN